MPPRAEDGVLPLLTSLVPLAENFFFSPMLSVTLSFAFFFLILFYVHMFMYICVELQVRLGTPK